MDWKYVKSLFSKNYTLIYNHYIGAQVDDLDVISKFCNEWYTARAYKMMIGEGNYHEYREKYEALFIKYPNYAEPIYELCQSSPTVYERYELYKKCMACTVEIEKTGVLDWKAPCGFLVECYNLEKYNEAYDIWIDLQKEGILEKVGIKYLEWMGCVRKCGEAVVEKMDNMLSYTKFRSDLRNIGKTYAPSTSRNTHMVWVKGYRQYSVIQYLAIRCAHDMRSVEGGNIYIYNDIEPENNEWWELSKKYATILHVTPPTHINGKHIPYPQHVADIMRICIIYEFGGMYIDSDLLLIKNVSGIMEEYKSIPFGNVVMCKETDNKIWNGMIIAEAHNSFLKRWIREYETKYGDASGGCWWAGLSVETPMRLYKEDCTDVVLLDTHTFLPFGFYDDSIYRNGSTNPYPLSYGIHLWETEAEKRGVLPKNREWFESNEGSIFAYLFFRYL